MKNLLFILLLIPFFALHTAWAQTPSNDTLINRYKEYLFRTNDAEQDIDSFIKRLDPSGKWPDIDYADSSLADWKITIHLRRVRTLSFAWANPRSSHYQDPAIRKVIDIALDHWLQIRYQSKNWWYNEIGVPQLMRDIIVLLRQDLDSLRLQQALAVMGQLRVHEDYVGGNLIWCADLGLHYGALIGDENLLNKCRQLILKEIEIGTGEGIQPDYSFHQHGKRLQMFQYGKAYLWESMRIAWELRDTPLAFPEEKIQILMDMVVEGWQWMARGIHTVPGTMDRSSSRKGELRSADMRLLLPFIKELQPQNTAITTMEAMQNGQGTLVGYRYYPYSDFAVFHRPGFSFFLKTVSTRTLPTESINSENLKGKLLNSGDTYLIRNGEEYFDLLPAWDWTALPGLTTFKEMDHVSRRPFVGGVSDNIDGFSVMDYVLQDKTEKQEFSARKFWASHGDVVVCLIGDMKSKGISGPLYTSLDQSRLQSDVTVNSVENALTPGTHSLDDVRWIHHSGFAYIPLKPTVFTIHLKKVESNWTSINAAGMAERVEESVFLPQMLHNMIGEDSSGYVIAPASSPKQTARLTSNPSWTVLRNGEACQAVEFKGGILMAAFYSPGELNFGKKQAIQVDQPCLILIKGGVLYASDPTQEGKEVNVTVGGKKFKIRLPLDGTTTQLPLK